MLLSVAITCGVWLVVATLLLVTAGHRLRRGGRPVSVAAVLVGAVAAAELAGRVLLLASPGLLAAAAVLAGTGLLVVVARPQWNVVGQVFFAALVASAAAYLTFTAYVTIAGGLSPAGVAASALLWLLEAAALLITAVFAFESVDVLCRTRWQRRVPAPDPAYRPKVSLHVPAYNEPPDMLIETVQALEGLAYPDLEIVVIDNNTADEAVWRPVEAYCAGRERVRFVHVAPLAGFKSGALNLVLRRYTDPDAELVGVVDADYLVRPDYLERTVGYFADPGLAFVQTPQDYREYEGDRYLTACYDAYKYFFETAMPSRNERDSIIFGGTMGLIRRSVLDGIGGWDERCITEDAEASLRMLRAGYSGLYLNESFGHGIMPLTFTALKKQRFRWCFGGIQILRKHVRSLLPWDRDPANHLSLAQRLDYLVGGLQWFGDLLGLAFTAVLVASGLLLATVGRVSLRPLASAALVLPVVILGSGLLRALWALRRATGITLRRATGAFATWLALSWTTALACMQGLVRSQGVFLRTPKWRHGPHLLEALRETRSESALTVGCWALAAGLALSGHRGLIVVLLAWQGLVYAASPFMGWLNQRTELTSRLARRQRSEERRERLAVLAPRAAAGGIAVTLTAAVAMLFLGATATPGARQSGLFTPQVRDAGDRGPLTALLRPAPPAAAAASRAPTSAAAPGSRGVASPGMSGAPADGEVAPGDQSAAVVAAAPAVAPADAGSTPPPSSPPDVSAARPPGSPQDTPAPPASTPASPGQPVHPTPQPPTRPAPTSHPTGRSSRP